MPEVDGYYVECVKSERCHQSKEADKRVTAAAYAREDESKYFYLAASPAIFKLGNTNFRKALIAPFSFCPIQRRVSCGNECRW